LLPHAATLLPPLFALKQGVSENLWQCGSKLRKIHIHISEIVKRKYFLFGVLHECLCSDFLSENAATTGNT